MIAILAPCDDAKSKSPEKRRQGLHISTHVKFKIYSKFISVLFLSFFLAQGKKLSHNAWCDSSPNAAESADQMSPSSCRLYCPLRAPHLKVKDTMMVIHILNAKYQVGVIHENYAIMPFHSFTFIGGCHHAESPRCLHH